MILAINTSQPDAQLLLLDTKGSILSKFSWNSNRNLAAELLQSLESFIERNKLVWEDIVGIVTYSGVGSFTGIRIGVTTANALAYSYGIPSVVATEEDWLVSGSAQIQKLPSRFLGATVSYHSSPNIT